jgi:predicted anti-sigma-YlaC factor YlaD
MDCPRCQEILSANLDGEDRPGELELARRHLAGCAECRAFDATITSLQRGLRLVPADPVPDRTAEILAAAAPGVPPRDERRVLRVALAVIAAVQLAVAAPALLLGEDAGLPVHYARHLGSLDVALAVGFLLVAYRPARFVTGVLPVAAAAVACILGSTLLDVASGSTGAPSELSHVTEAAGVVAIWLVGRSAFRPVLS